MKIIIPSLCQVQNVIKDYVKRKKKIIINFYFYQHKCANLNQIFFFFFILCLSYALLKLFYLYKNDLSFVVDFIIFRTQE